MGVDHECGHLMGAEEGVDECSDHVMGDHVLGSDAMSADGCGGHGKGDNECGLHVIGSDEYGGVLLIPVGYRFLPTDEEMVVHYLLKKILNLPLPAPVIQDIDALELYSKSPVELDKNSCKRENMFFIHHQQTCKWKSTYIRMVGGDKGYWRLETEIMMPFGNLLAIKTYFTYYSGKPSNEKKTNWVMEEYQLRCKRYVGKKREIMSNDEYKVLANPFHEPRVSIAVFFNPGKREDLYGPLPEVISQEKPALYGQFSVRIYGKVLLKRVRRKVIDKLLQIVNHKFCKIKIWTHNLLYTCGVLDIHRDVCYALLDVYVIQMTSII